MSEPDVQAPQAAPSSPAESPSPNSLLGQITSPDEGMAALEAPAQKDWAQIFSEEYRNRPYLKDFKDPDSFLKSFENKNSLIGKKLEHMNEDDLRHVRETLGIPKSPEDYRLSLPEEMPREGLNEDWFRNTMRDANIPQKEAAVLYEKYAGLVQSQMQAMELDRKERLSKGDAELNQVFGLAKEQRLKGIVDFIKSEGGEDLLNTFNASDLALDPKMIVFLSKMAEVRAQDKGINLSQSASWGVSPSDAIKQIESLKSDPSFMAQLAPNHPNKAEAQARWTRLFQLAYPD